MMEEEEAIEKRPKKKTTHTPHNIVLIICIAAYCPDMTPACAAATECVFKNILSKQACPAVSAV